VRGILELLVEVSSAQSLIESRSGLTCYPWPSWVEAHMVIYSIDSQKWRKQSGPIFMNVA